MKQEPSEVDQTRRSLELARAEVNRQHPDKAIEYVRALRFEDSEDGVGQLWLESRLVLAESYMAKGDAAAEAFFSDVFEAVQNSERIDPQFELRANEHFGDYLSSFAHCLSQARPRYDRAKRIAVELRQPEDTARIQLKIERMELAVDKHPESDNFTTLKSVAGQDRWTYEQQLAVWCQHKGSVPIQHQGLRYARNKSVAAPDYFRHLFKILYPDPR